MYEVWAHHPDGYFELATEFYTLGAAMHWIEAQSIAQQGEWVKYVVEKPTHYA